MSKLLQSLRLPLNPMPIYKLTLYKSYYDKGFFNLGVDVERFVRPDSGPCTLRLGESKAEVRGRVDREANQNGTPRIFGGAELRDWFQGHFKLEDVVDVFVTDPDELWLKRP